MGILDRLSVAGMPLVALELLRLNIVSNLMFYLTNRKSGMHAVSIMVWLPMMISTLR